MQLDTRRKFLDKTKKQVKTGFSKSILIIQAIRAIDDVDKCKSLLYSRMLEWARLNFPEASGNDDFLINLFAEFGSRENIDFIKLQEMVGEEQATKVFEVKEKSFGKDFSNKDAKMLKEFAKSIAELSSVRTKLENYVLEACKEEAPNMTALAGELLTARLLALAGSLENLAEMPASTIQVIGAEKALFQHLRFHSRPPKHGVIFQHSSINSASDSQRGKIARALAGKLSIAARTDYYSKHDVSQKLKTAFEKRVKQIKAAPEKPRKAFVPSNKPKHLRPYSERRQEIKHKRFKKNR